MQFIPDLSTKRRTHNITPPDIRTLMQGIGFLAVGTIFASIFVCEVSILFRFISLMIGIVLCAIGIVLLRKYTNASKAFREYIPSWDKGRGIFDIFAAELNDWYNNHRTPTACDGDTVYFLQLQKDRLRSKELTMQQQIAPTKNNSMGTATLTRKSQWYTADNKFEQTTRHITFSRNNETLYERDIDEYMHETIIHNPNESQLDHMTLTCPNCGAVSLVSDLTSGCKYCNTHFEIKDLFPRVTNMYFYKTTSSGKFSNITRNTILCSMLVCFLFSLIGTLPDEDIAPPLALFSSYFAALLVGGLFGLIISNVILLFTAFNQDGRKRIPFFKSITAKGKITRTMRQYDRNFSIDKFEGQIISLIRMVVFANNSANLTACKATTLDPRFQNIVEMTHISTFVVKRIRKENNLLHMTLRTWWINYNDIDGKIKKTGDCIDITISKDISHAETPGFSITSVNCRNCGGSFDAVRQRICPYCQTEYHMEYDNWVVEDMQLLR